MRGNSKNHDNLTVAAVGLTFGSLGPHGSTNAPQDFKNDPQFWGISCTGSISTNYRKRGNHHAWISVNGGPIKKRTWNMHIKLEKGLRNRIEEDQIISYAMIKFLLATSNSKFEIKNIDYSQIFKIKLSTEEKIEISKS